MPVFSVTLVEVKHDSNKQLSEKVILGPKIVIAGDATKAAMAAARELSAEQSMEFVKSAIVPISYT